MKAKLKLQNIDEVQATMTVTLSMREWKNVRDRLKQGVDANYHGDAHNYLSVIQRLVAKVETELEAPEEIED